jgi:hypothetical protein
VKLELMMSKMGMGGPHYIDIEARSFLECFYSRRHPVLRNYSGDDGCGSLVPRQLFPRWHRDTGRRFNVCHDQPHLISSVTADWRIALRVPPVNHCQSDLNDALFWDRGTALATFQATPAKPFRLCAT